MPKHADRVYETTSTEGLADFVLAGSQSGGFRTFATAFSDGDQIEYVVASATGSQWETGRGVYVSATNSISRDQIIASSAAGAKVDFTAGAKRISAGLSAQTLLDLEVGVGAAQSTADQGVADAAAAQSNLDVHVTDSAIHRAVNDAGSGPTDLLSAQAIDNRIESQIAEWNGAAWTFYSPVDGVNVAVADEEMIYVFDADDAIWRPFGTWVSHNNLAGIAGDAAGYHLSNAQFLWTSAASGLGELATLLDGKSDVGHVHDAANITSGTMGLDRLPTRVMAWAVFSGDGAVQIGYNIASVTRNAAGNYNVNFQTPMPHAGYAVSLSGRSTSVVLYIERHDAPVRNTNTFGVYTLNGGLTPADPEMCSVVVYA